MFFYQVKYKNVRSLYLDYINGTNDHWGVKEKVKDIRIYNDLILVNIIKNIDYYPVKIIIYKNNIKKIDITFQN